MILRCVPLLLAATLLGSSPADLDRDSLDDALEQRLLEQFAPAFQLSKNECDSRPAEFRPGLPHPAVLRRNGVIYGQAFPHPGTFAVELHYYHLWSRDCGRAGHPLDAEHVSALVQPTHDGQWRARFWYAAAHQDTVCDCGNAAPAAAVGAVAGGPLVYVSQGKHASFLSLEACRKGCGGDACSLGALLRPSRIVNLGEPGHFTNGAEWVQSTRWPLLAKMRSDFPPDLLARLDDPTANAVFTLNPALRTPQTALLVGDSTIDALAASGGATSGALAATSSALGKSLRRTAGALGKAVRFPTRESKFTYGTKKAFAIGKIAKALGD